MDKALEVKQRADALDELKLKQIEKALDLMSSTTNWVIGSLVLIAFAIYNISKDETIYILGFKLDEKVAGLAIYTVVFGLNLYILKLSDSLRNGYKAMSETGKQRGKELLQNHLWICNPFAKTREGKNSFFDSVGYGLFTVLWWIGFVLGFKLSIKMMQSPAGLTVTIVIMILYSAVGILTAGIYGNLWGLQDSFMESITPNKKRQRLSLCLYVLSVLAFLLFIFWEFKDRIIKIIS